MLIGIILLIIFVPEIYFSSTLSLLHPDQNKFGKNKINSRLSSEDNSIYRESFDTVAPSNHHSRSFSILNNLCIILKQKIFMFCVLSLASLFFVITAVQYWGSDYMENTLKVKDKHIRLLSFTIVCITSPTLGVIIGGCLSTKIGGYESKHSILLCLIFAFCAGIFSIPVPMVDSLLLFTVFLWFVLFFGGAILPPLTGIIISTLPKSLRGSANSITTFFCNLFGYLPSPFVYGFINNYFKGTNDRIAFYFIMYYSFIGMIFLSFGAYFRYKTFDKHNKTTPLVEDYRATRASLLSNDIVKIYGNYLNVEHGREVLEKNDDKEYKDDEEKKICTPKSEITKPIETIEDYDLPERNLTKSEKSGPLSVETPKFNVNDSQRMNYWDPHDFVDLHENSNTCTLNEDSSIFGKKVVKNASSYKTAGQIVSNNIFKEVEPLNIADDGKNVFQRSEKKNSNV